MRTLSADCLRGRAAAVLIVSALALGSHGEDQRPALGEPMSEAAIAAVDLTVLPNGVGLPSGEGSVELGASVYRGHCAACHGSDGSGGVNDRLVGGVGSIGSTEQIRTTGSYWPYATTIFDYIRRAMPLPTPGRLSNDELYGVTAFLLHQNGIIDADAVMDAKTLPLVKMPNRHGFRFAIELQ